MIIVTRMLTLFDLSAISYVNAVYERIICYQTQIANVRNVRCENENSMTTLNPNADPFIPMVDRHKQTTGSTMKSTSQPKPLNPMAKSFRPFKERKRKHLPKEMKLNCIAWNIRGLGDKLVTPDVQNLLQNKDIILLTESWIEQKDEPPDLANYTVYNFPSGYHHPQAWRACGGQVVIYTSSKNKSWKIHT